MPKKPKTPCRYPGCPKLVENGYYCEEHKRLVDKQYNLYQRDKSAAVLSIGGMESAEEKKASA